MTQPVVPRDARIVALIASSMGIQNCEPAVLAQLLHFAHRYTYDVLQDAITYADHGASASRGAPSSVTLDDLQLAVQSRVNYSFTQPPSKEMLLSLASSLNTVPLPPLSDGYGLRLPPRKHRLTNVNFNILPNVPPPGDLSDDDDAAEDGETAGPSGPTEAGQRRDFGPSSTEAASRPLDEDEDYDDAEDATKTAPSQPKEPEEARGTKRALDEDEDYD